MLQCILYYFQCLGQHNFNDLTKSIYPFVKKIRYPLIVANLHFIGHPYLMNYIKPSIILIRNNKRIGFVGYISTLTSFSLISNTSVNFENEMNAVRREARILKRRGVDTIIALGHSGFSTDKKIASEIDDVDIVVGGLTNTLLWNGAPPNTENINGPYPTIVSQKSGKRVPVVQTYGFAKYLGRLKIRFNDMNRLVDCEGNPIFLKEYLPQDPTILSMLKIHGKALRRSTDDDVVLGQSIVPLSAENVSTSESNLANFVADCLLEYAKAKSHVATFSLINAGAFRGKIATSRSNPNITKGVRIYRR